MNESINSMKDFMKMVLASMTGMFLFIMAMTIIGIIAIASIIASENSSVSIEENSILRISLSGVIEERTETNPINSLLGKENDAMALDNILQAIDKAAKNENVKGIYLEGGALSATPAMLQEIRQALVDFHKSGKFIWSYGDQYSQASYYLCSAADSVMLNPSGMVDWHGLASEPIFFKDVLDKIGVKMQVYKVGTFKSAVEPFVNTEMSDANREQVTSYLNSIWSNMLSDVAASRKIKTETLNTLADSMMLFRMPADAKNAHMVDKLCYLDEMKKMLRNKVGLEEDETLNFVDVNDMARAEDLTEVSDNKIAVYYAYGDIVDQAASNVMGGGNINPQTMNTDLQKLADDEDIKAVVIRVNSGGGSAYASEQIWHQIELLKEKKPVVVSMGGMAASGGYYISSGANKIYAEPTTLTGSIGIFGMIPDVSELMTQKIGVKFDVVKTNALSDFGSMSRPLNEKEGAMMQAYINQGYEQFTGRVAIGRKMSVENVKKIAEGRVWTGEQALKIGLVDKLGNLNDAIKEAARLAKCNDYNVARYPLAKSWWDNLTDAANDNDYMESQMRAMLGEYYTSFALLRSLKGQNPVQARIPFDPNIH